MFVPAREYCEWVEDEQSSHKEFFISQTETAGTGARENPGEALQL